MSIRQICIVFSFCISLVGLSSLALATQAQTNYHALHSFGPDLLSGSSPRGNLIQSSDGFLFGITYGGGSNDCGTIFKSAADGTSFQVLHQFAATTLAPVAGLVEAPNGVLYGTLRGGGAGGGGAIYRISKTGSGFALVHEFNTVANDGRTPLAGLMVASDGYLYGTTSAGGISNVGTIFRIKPNGTSYSVTSHFYGTNGAAPYARLIEGRDGNLYGTTRRGGNSNFGVVYKVPKSGGTITILHHFRGTLNGDGKEPFAELVQAQDGVLYGTTYAGGNADVGSIFKVNTNGAGYSVIYHCLYTATGYQPVAGLVQGGDGMLYGTFSVSGSGYGVVFRIGTTGSGYSIIHSFTGAGGDGGFPYAPILEGVDGALYGSTFSGGAYAGSGVEGTLFRLLPSPSQVVITNIAPGPNGFVLSFAGADPGQTYRVLATTNRLNQSWIDLGPATAAGNGTFQFTDSNSVNFPQRFYRSRTP